MRTFTVVTRISVRVQAEADVDTERGCPTTRSGAVCLAHNQRRLRNSIAYILMVNFYHNSA